MATSELLNELYIKNGLVKDIDTFDLKFGKRTTTIITRNGIEKIQYHHNIQVTYEVITMMPEFIVIKAIATKGDLVMESFGEASPQNTKQSYPVAMAEKRSLSRVILKITGFYKYGLMGEDESDDFKRQA
jgi:hypothetical protein